QDSTMPTFTGKGSATQAIDTDHGAVFDIGSGVIITFPKGLPVGHSRIITFQKAKKKPAPAQIHKGFVPVGAPLELNVPLNGGSKPIRLTLTTKSNPEKRNMKLVLAMEIGTLCTAENKSAKLPNGLCAGWELEPASYSDSDQRVVAELQSTGGMRMVFGLSP